jgi:uncharacterized protein (TIGR03437 family)
MLRLMVLAVLILATAFAQAPTYTADSIVKASDYSSGPFAPNSVLSIFGSNLSWYTYALQEGDIAGDTLPIELQGVQVYVDDWPSPMLYVSGGQINFIVPSNQLSGNVTVRVVREGVTGPEITIALAEAAPALFDTGSGFAIATHVNGTLLTNTAPGQPGEIVVVYATGLGATEPNPPPGQIPQSAASLVLLSSLTVSLNGVALPSTLIQYAGATPDSVGLYQLNIQLPGNVGANPAIQVTVGTQSSSATLAIVVQ